MSDKANYYKLGLFVIGAVAVGFAILLTFGGPGIFSRTYTMETYFNESVQGLDIGSKVRYRGVPIGEVRKIGFTYTRYETDKPSGQRKRYVLVETALRPELVGPSLWQDERAQHEIDRGLRVRLTAQGITGQVYLEIDYVDPNSNPQLPISWTPENFYIPSARSTVMRFVDAAESLMDRLQKADIDDTMRKINRLVTSLTSQVEQLKLDELSRRANRVLDQMDNAHFDKLGTEATHLVTELRQSNAQLQTMLANPAWQKVPEDTAAAAKQARQILEAPDTQAAVIRLQRTLKRLDHLFAGRDAEIAVSLDNLKQITDNLRDLSEQVKRSPSDLLFTAPPPNQPR
jgi:paraquat-inducible protein B